MSWHCTKYIDHCALYLESVANHALFSIQRRYFKNVSVQLKKMWYPALNWFQLRLCLIFTQISGTPLSNYCQPWSAFWQHNIELDPENIAYLYQQLQSWIIWTLLGLIVAKKLFERDQPNTYIFCAFYCCSAWFGSRSRQAMSFFQEWQENWICTQQFHLAFPLSQGCNFLFNLGM